MENFCLGLTSNALRRSHLSVSISPVTQQRCHFNTQALSCYLNMLITVPDHTSDKVHPNILNPGFILPCIVSPRICQTIPQTHKHLDFHMNTLTYLVAVDRGVATVRRVSIVLCSAAVLHRVSLSTLQSGTDRKTFIWEDRSIMHICIRCAGGCVCVNLVMACIFSPSSMLWDRACWLLCLLIRANTLSWCASYSSRLG